MSNKPLLSGALEPPPCSWYTRAALAMERFLFEHLAICGRKARAVEGQP